ncbi:hypothetical protein LINPERPRIM_LOCUS3527, partial [Linum perenne]
MIVYSPGPVTQEMVELVDKIDAYNTDVWADNERCQALTMYMWNVDLAQEEVLFDTQHNIGRLSRQEFMTCRPGCMLSNFFIDTYEQCTNILFKQTRFCDRFIFGTECASMCSNKAYSVADGLEYIQGKSWITDIDWMKVDYWFFPMCYEQHFVVFCVNLKNRCGDYLDSLDRAVVPEIYMRTSKNIMDLANNLIPMFRSNPAPEPIDVDKWVNHRGIRQADNTSCGIFALNLMEEWEG